MRNLEIRTSLFILVAVLANRGPALCAPLSIESMIDVRPGPATDDPSPQYAKASESVCQEVLHARTIRKFHAAGATVRDCFNTIARGTGLPCAEETVPCRGTSLADLEKPVRLDLADVSVSDVLDSLVRGNPAYTWRWDGQFLRLIPAGAAADPAYPLSRKIAEYKAVAVNLLGAEEILWKEPETKGIRASPLDFLARVPTDWRGDDVLYNVERTNASLRDLIDALARRLGESWGMGPDPSGHGLEYGLGPAAAIIPPEPNLSVERAPGYPIGLVELPPGPGMYYLKVARINAAHAPLPEYVGALAKAGGFRVQVQMIPCVGATIDDLLRPVTYSYDAVANAAERNGQLRVTDVLSQLAGRSQAWELSQDSQDVRLFPAGRSKDPTYPMSVKIPSFKAKGLTLRQTVDRLIGLISKARPEWKFVNLCVHESLDANGDPVLINMDLEGKDATQILDILCLKLRWSCFVRPCANPHTVGIELRDTPEPPPPGAGKVEVKLSPPDDP